MIPYIYALYADSIGVSINGHQEYRYIGKSSCDENRRKVHSATQGAKSTRPWFREAAKTGYSIDSKILMYCSKEDVDLMEQKAWDSYVRAGHRILNERPMSVSKEALRRATEVRREQKLKNHPSEIKRREGRKRGLQTQASGGYSGLKRGHATQAENGHPELKTARASMFSLPRDHPSVVSRNRGLQFGRKKHSEETNAKMSKALVAAWARRKAAIAANGGL